MHAQRFRLVAQIRQIESDAVRDARELTAFELATIDRLWRQVDEIEARLAPRSLDPQPSPDDDVWSPA